MGGWVPQLDAIQQAAIDIFKSRNASIESVLESALATGTHGVLVIEESIDFFHVQATTDVPYGQIHRFPSRAAYAEWLKAGGNL